jgi:solute carrier family 35 protein
MSKRKDLSMVTAKKLLPVSIFYNANVAFALASLKGVNIPMYIAIKRLTPLAVLVSGFLRGKGKPPTQVKGLFSLMQWLHSSSCMDNQPQAWRAFHPK